MAKRDKTSSSTQLAMFFPKGSMPISNKDAAKALSTMSVQRSIRLSKPLLRFTKSGEWVFGAESEELEIGTELAVNPLSFRAGYIAWNKDGGVAGEKMVSLLKGEIICAEDLPKVDSENGWQEQLSIELAGLKADRNGFRDEVIYKTTSKGGKECLENLRTELVEALEDNDGKVPVVKLEATNYRHKKYGKVNKPIMTLVKWVNP